jgi:hypothetical protein
MDLLQKWKQILRKKEDELIKVWNSEIEKEKKKERRKDREEEK